MTHDDRAREVPDDILELMARAHDAEESAQRGEPSPWRNDIAGADPDFHDERIAAMRCAVAALTRAGLRVVPAEPSDADVERVARALGVYHYGADTDWQYHAPQARAALRAFLAQGGGDE